MTPNFFLSQTGAKCNNGQNQNQRPVTLANVENREKDKVRFAGTRIERRRKLEIADKL